MILDKTFGPLRGHAVQSGEKRSPAPVTEHSMEGYISQVLRIGVFSSAAIILVGLILYITQGAAGGTGQQSVNQVIDTSRSVSVSPSSIYHGVLTGNSVAIIQLGVLALILTPMTRVAMTAVLFLMQRDRVFVTITTIVFLVLVFGLIGIGS